MALGAAIILAFGPLQWSFPWWVWLLLLLCDGAPTVKIKK